jgi:hypothetical protein
VTLRSSILQCADAIDRALEQRFWRWSSLFIAFLFATLVVQDVRTRLWTDEFFTLFMAKQGGLAAIVSAAVGGLDSAPPLYSIIVHFVLPIVGHEALAARLPATIGYCSMLAFLAAVSRRRLGASYAWIPPLLVFAVCLYYASEARAYGLVLGCAAAALFFWQRATDQPGTRRAALLLALSIGLATALHYYSIFLTMPLLVGEILRRRSQRFDRRILLAIGSSAIVLAAHYPIIAITRDAFTFFWSPPTWNLVDAFYDEYVRTIAYVCGGFALVALAIFPASRADLDRRCSRTPAHEWAAAFAMVLIPPVAVAASILLTGAFVDRYVLWANLGAGLLAGALLRRAAGAQPVVGILVSALLAVQVAGHQARALLEPQVLRRGEPLSQALPALPDNTGLLLVPHVFLELSFYGDPRWRDRLAYPLSGELELRYRGSDTTTRMMTAASTRTSLRIVDYSQVLMAEARLVLLCRPDDYLLRHLLDEGFRISAISSPVGLVLFEAVRPGTGKG